MSLIALARAGRAIDLTSGSTVDHDDPSSNSHINGGPELNIISVTTYKGWATSERRAFSD